MVYNEKNATRGIVNQLQRILKPENVTILVDSREKLPWDLSPMRMEKATLATGDYSIKGLDRGVVCVERKSLVDLVQCCGREHDRFREVVQRMCGYEARVIVIEASLKDVHKGAWRGKVKPETVSGCILSWMAKGIPVYFAGDARTAQMEMARFLFGVARRRYGELLQFGEGLER